MNCSNCGGKLEPSDVVCPRCGHPAPTARALPHIPAAPEPPAPAAMSEPPPASCDHAGATPGLSVCDVCGGPIPTAAPASHTGGPVTFVLLLPWGEHRVRAGDVLDIGREVAPWRDDLAPFTTVGRRHATLRVTASGHLLLRDHSSLNGTYINEVRVPGTGEQEVPDGAVVSLSRSFSFTVRREPCMPG